MIKFKLFNPLYFFNLLWIVLIIGHKLSFTLWNAKETNYFWLYIAMISFSIGSSFSYIYMKNKKQIKNIIITKKHLKKIYLFFKIFVIIYFAEESCLYYLKGLPPLLSKNTLRSVYYLKGIGIFYYLYISIFLMGNFLKGYKYKVFTVNIIYIFVFLCVILKGNKFAIVEIILLNSISKYILNGKEMKNKEILKKIIIIIILIIFMNKFFYMKYYDLNINKIIEINKYRGDKIWAIFIMPYLYIFSNVENIINYINYNDSITYGTNTFFGILKLLNIDKVFPNMFMNNFKNSLHYSWLNTGSYLLPVVSDYKYFGIIIYSYFYGMITQYYYLKIYKLNSRNLKDLCIYILLFISLLLCFFTNYLSTISFSLNLIIIFILEKIGGFKKKNEKNFSNYG